MNSNSKEMKRIIDAFKKPIRLNENLDNLSDIRKYIYDYYNLDDVIEPATVPLKPNYVRLYHQTDLENFENIKRERKIDIKKSTGNLNKEPTIVWGKIVTHKDDKGFYGYPKKRFTIEYQLPTNEVDKGTGGIARTVNANEIIAYHDPRLFHLKEAVDDNDILSTIKDNLNLYMKFIDNGPNSNEYNYYLIAKAIKFLNQK